MTEFTSDGVDHPQHYNDHPANIECIDIVEHYGFNIGNAMKYLWRAGLKPGETVLKDLEKAAWYVQREIKRLNKQKLVGEPSTLFVPRKNEQVIQNLHAASGGDALPPESEITGINRLNDDGSITHIPFAKPVKHKELGKVVILDENDNVVCSGCEKATRLEMDPLNLDHSCGIYPKEGLVTGVKHRRLPSLLDSLNPIPTMPPIIAEPAVISIPPDLEHISDIKIGEPEVAVEPEKKPSAASSGTSEQEAATTADQIFNKLYHQKPCAMCDAPTWKSILKRNNGYCTKCKSKLTKEKITQEFNEERAAKPHPDPKDELNDQAAAEYLFGLLKNKFPVRGDFLVQDAMSLIHASYPCAIKYLKILQRQGKLYTKSPHDLQDLQKWHIAKDKRG